MPISKIANLIFYFQKKRQYLETKEESKVIQIYGDSAELDFSKLGGPFDLVFIDGDHSQFYAYSDTVKSLSVLNPGGVIIWHDYEMQSVSSVIDRASAMPPIIGAIIATERDAKAVI